jgi:putative radical SAM enzyme (TIGR03279 family)
MKIAAIEAGTPAERAGLRPGDDVVAVNGAPLRDALDFTYHTDDEVLCFALRRPDGNIAQIEVARDEDGRLGVVLAPDPVRCCGNRCVFCFIDQNPPGLRPSLYVKDEDYRLSPFYGNYVTLTNLKVWEIERIIEQHLDPLYVSVHATDPSARERLLRRRERRALVPLMRRLGEAGITMHTQIVLVPGYNDGAVLERTLADLEALHPAVQTVAVVPVGLTRYRGDLTPLRAVTAPEAAALVEMLEARAERCRIHLGTRLHFAADELYLLAGRPLPAAEAYEGFPQIENGVGMVRSFEHELAEAKRVLAPGAIRGAARRAGGSRRRAVFVTGMLFAPLLAQVIGPNLARTGEGRFFDADVLAVHNDLFGPGVTVAGLLGAKDIAAALAACGPYDLAVLPREILNDDGVTLDHYTPDELAGWSGRPVQIGLAGDFHGLQGA